MKYTKEEALIHKEYHSALCELLFQLADDDFILAYRGSEWLGLAPHIEEDVAFSSISQDMMGHAVIFYGMLEDLGIGKANDLAHDRPAEERKNAILLERVNGPGTYLHEPHYDWAFAVVRSYFYTGIKKIKIASLKNSSYIPLSQAAVKIEMELYYHLLHWKTWFTQLLGAGGEAKKRIEDAMAAVFPDLDGVFSFGAARTMFIRLALITSEEEIRQEWIQMMRPIFESLGINMPNSFGLESGNGRDGVHTEDLEAALKTLTEVYRIDQTASW
ncbi:1,2-phenylacetyl-CoA epoxidase subunit PaaC [Peribacillus kribbensis]|uniref:1,2-phenylacetyl-CoA epoxidase subunit PaaC n=1 Tax=Peribacillus kribbensis TaxID=356658 RepID=UPI0003FCFABA|nr:1,2-phenylacetyl-CoA epoxidase subunit PaaC [Peribacillus kribbensis]